MVTWWSSPLDRAAADRFGQFDQRGIVPIGYAAFAVALGLAAGIVIRRTLPAMAVTLVGFVAARLADTSWVRPNLVSPAHMNSPLSASNSLGFTAGPTFVTGSPTIPNAMVISSHLAGAAGRTPTRAAVHQLLVKACPGITSPPPPGASGHQHAVAASALAFRHCIDRLAARYHLAVTYQPAGRYWTLQWLELGVFLAAALALAGLSFWWMRRRLA